MSCTSRFEPEESNIADFMVRLSVDMIERGRAIIIRDQCTQLSPFISPSSSNSVIGIIFTSTPKYLNENGPVSNLVKPLPPV